MRIELSGKQYVLPIKYMHHYTHINKFWKEQDGRGAYFALYDNLLGQETIQIWINKVENDLQSLSWDDKVKKGWNFDKYNLASRTLRNWKCSTPPEMMKGSNLVNLWITNAALNPVITVGNNYCEYLTSCFLEAYQTHITQQKLHPKTGMEEFDIFDINWSMRKYMNYKLKK